MTVTIVTPPASEPVTAADAQEHSNVTGDTNLLEGMITAARQNIELYLDRALITQTLKLAVDSFPHQPWYQPNALPLPRAPLQSVASVKYYDLDDTLQTFSTDNYVVLTDTEPGVVQLKYGQSWPSNIRPQNAVIVEYDAGYGDNASDVPDAIKRAILMQVASLHGRRDPGVASETIDNASVTYINEATRSNTTTGSGLTPLAEQLVSPYRVWSL